MSTSPATPTSTEPLAEQGRARFRRGLIATIAVLVLACAGLGAASVLQGPRIEGAQIDLATAVVAPASLRIVLDESIAPLAEGVVSVVPAVPFTVQTEGDVVLVQFATPLEYDTEYQVAMTGVSAAAGGVTADLSHDIHTPPFVATWLQRDPSGDRILTAGIGAEPTTLYTAARIQDFLPIAGGALLVVTLDDAGASEASIVATDGSGIEEELTPPGGVPGRIEVLQNAGPTDVLYTFTSLETAEGGVPTFDQTLFRLDLTGTHISDPVIGLDGEPLAVDKVIPIPGSTAVLLHARAGDVLRYDPLSAEPPTLVAKYPDMVALAGDRHRLSVTDAFGPLIYDFDDGSETRIVPAPMIGSGAVPFIADAVPVRDARVVYTAVVPNADYTSFDTSIQIDDGAQSSPLLPAPDGGTILGFQVTPNDRYLIVEVSPGGDDLDARDGYEAESRPRDVETRILDIWQGDTVMTFPGSHARY